MNPIAIIICAFGTCFNPYQITYMETQRLDRDCIIHFGKGTPFTIEGPSCTELSAEINKQILEKSCK